MRQNTLSLPTVELLACADSPERCVVHWRCLDCWHQHAWIWMTEEARSTQPCTMVCEHCGFSQRMLFPSALPLDLQLAQRIAERDTEFAEALVEPMPPLSGDWPDALEARPVFPRECPDAFGDMPDEAAPVDTGARARKALIQDGRRLSQAAATIAERLMDRNWVQLRLDSSQHATDLIEMAAALQEFGA